MNHPTWRLALFCILTCASTLPSAAAVTTHGSIINFDAAKVVLSGATEQKVSRVPAVRSLSAYRMNLDLSRPLFSKYPALFGGLEIYNDGVGGTLTDWRFHPNNPDSAPNKPTVFFTTNNVASIYNHIHQVYLWRRDFFSGVASEADGVAFTPASRLSLNITDWEHPVIRFLICNGTQYYVSEAVLNGTGPLVLTDFADNATDGKRWAPVELSSTSFRLPDAAGLIFSATHFDNVTQVGWIGYGSRRDFAAWGFDKFSASAQVTSTPPPTPTNPFDALVADTWIAIKDLGWHYAYQNGPGWSYSLTFTAPIYSKGYPWLHHPSLAYLYHVEGSFDTGVWFYCPSRASYVWMHASYGTWAYEQTSGQWFQTTGTP